MVAVAKEVGVHRDLGDGLFETRCALDADLAVAKLEITWARFEHVPGHAQQFLLDDAGGADQRPGHHHRVAAASRAGAGKSVIRVRVGDADVVGIDL